VLVVDVPTERTVSGPGGEGVAEHRQPADGFSGGDFVLGAATGVADPQALADAPIVLYNGALATANTAKPARTAGITAGA
jgi:hypothetical protein